MPSSATATPIPGAGRVIESTDGAVTVNGYCIQPIGGDAVISAITLAPGFGDSSKLASKTLLDGAQYPFRFSAITLTSGTVYVCEEY